MTDRYNLRDRIADLLHGHFELTAIGPIGCGHEYWSDEEHVAQAIIDEFGLKREWRVVEGFAPSGFIDEWRVVGKWEESDEQEPRP